MRRPDTGGSEAGFTYLTLLLLIAVLAVVLSETAEIWHTAVQREKEAELLFVGQQFRNAIGSYFRDHAHYPHDLTDLLKDPQQAATRRYLRRIYRDPITGKAEWGVVQQANGEIVGVHSLSDAQPIKVAGFSRDDSGFAGAKKYSEWTFVFQPTRRIFRQPNVDSNGGKGIFGM
jgi:type II secretory pathway pseudopilin PulG